MLLKKKTDRTSPPMLLIGHLIMSTCPSSSLFALCFQCPVFVGKCSLQCSLLALVVTETLLLE